MSVLLEIIAVIQMLSVITLMEGSTVLVRRAMKEMVHSVKVCNTNDHIVSAMNGSQYWLMWLMWYEW